MAQSIEHLSGRVRFQPRFFEHTSSLAETPRSPPHSTVRGEGVLPACWAWAAVMTGDLANLLSERVSSCQGTMGQHLASWHDGMCWHAGKLFTSSFSLSWRPSDVHNPPVDDGSSQAHNMQMVLRTGCGEPGSGPSFHLHRSIGSMRGFQSLPYTMFSSKQEMCPESLQEL